MSKKVLITGGAGFIGHLVIEKFLNETDWEIIVIDRLSYAGNLTRVNDVITKFGENGEKRASFMFHDLKAEFNKDLVSKLSDINYIVHIGASSHVTNSIENPYIFVQDNIIGTFNLLELSRNLNSLELFYYFSTDEVFGPSYEDKKFLEWDRYNSKNPYSATKSAGEELTIAYSNTYDIPSLITHCSNVYGERQYWEKFVPNTIKKILNGDKVIIHTDSNNVPGSRYYMYNEDLAKTVLFLVLNFKSAQKLAYDKTNLDTTKVNITGESLISNLEVAEHISSLLNKDFNFELVNKDPSRPGHDIKYGLDNSLLKELGGVYDRKFEDGIANTVEWFKSNPEWLG